MIEEIPRDTNHSLLIYAGWARPVISYSACVRSFPGGIVEVLLEQSIGRWMWRTWIIEEPMTWHYVIVLKIPPDE